MKQIDQLLDEYRTEENLPFEPLSAEETKRILEQTLYKLDIERKEKMNVKKKLSITLLASTLTLGVLTAGAAAYLSLDKNFVDFLHPANDAQVQTLNTAGTAIDKQVIQNGYTIHVKQSIGDIHQMYVLFDVIAPEGTKLTQEEYSFQMVRLMSEKNKGMGYSVYTIKDDDPADNKISMVLSASSDTTFVGDTVSLELDGLQYYDMNEPDLDNRMKTLTPGTWKISFDLNYQNISKTYDVNRKINIFGGESTIKSISLSPLSVSVEIKGKSVQAYDETGFLRPGDTELVPAEEGMLTALESFDENMQEDALQQIILKFKDGTLLTANESGSSIDKDTLIQTSTYDRMIDLEQIQSVTVHGQEIQMNQ